ncbi:DegT/DnrJ/EryC1/StrS family aminotransferase, partial [Arthrospira platensis SPKY2]
LKDVKGIRCIENTGQLVSNYAYFPILVELDYPLTRDALYDSLREHNIYGRRYFYPLISDFPMYRGSPSAHPDNLLVAHKIANQVICLPIYPGLTNEQIEYITTALR